MDIKDRYWAMLDQHLMEYEYFNHYLLESKRNETIAKIVASFSGSAGVVSLAIWNMQFWDKVEFIKPLILSVSGLAAFVSQFLPYSKRAAVAAEVVPELWGAYLQSERDYQQVRHGDLSNDQVNELLYQYENSYHEIKKKHCVDALFPQSKKVKEKAEEITNDRMKQRFCQMDSDDILERNESNEQPKANSVAATSPTTQTAITISAAGESKHTS